MSLDPQTRQQLLELVYDLLPGTEAAELRRRIDAEPDLARAYAEAQAAAKLFAEAARLRVPQIDLPCPQTAVSAPAGPSPPQTPWKAAGQRSTPWARGANWAVGLAAAVLLMVSVGGYLYHRRQLQQIAAGHMRLQVTGPAQLQAGAETNYTVTTSSITGQPLPALIKFAVYSPEEAHPKWHNEATDEDGRLQVAVAGDERLSSRAVLKVVAQREDTGETQEVETRLAVEPVRYATQLALDKPLYRPGETIYYRSLTLSRFGLAADDRMRVQFEILDPGGAVVAGSKLEGVAGQGVGNGAFKIPPELAGGRYVLVARSVADLFPEEKRPFFIRRYRLPRLKKELEFTRDSYGPGDPVAADFLAQRAEGGAAAGATLQIIATVDDETVLRKSARADDAGGFQVQFDLPEEIQRGDGQLVVVIDDGGTRETMAKPIPINLGKVEVAFYPEGGDLVDGLENRVYFTARDPLGDPVHVEGTVVDAKGREVAIVKTTHEGMGSFSFAPLAEAAYRLKITSPANTENEPELPEVSTERKIVLTTGSGVFDAGAPLEFNVRAAEPDVPLVISAWCRGVQVGQQTLVTEVGENGNGANAVAIALADEVGGVVRLTVHDYSVPLPKPVAERLVYRRMGRRLQVRAGGSSQRYSPGEKVTMSLRVTDENDRPVPAVLGVAVVDDALLSLADDRTPSMTTHFLLTTEVEKPEDLEDAEFYLSDDPEAAVALDLLLGTQGWRRFVEKTLDQLDREEGDQQQLTRLVALSGPGSPPVMFDNLGEIRTDYEQRLAQYQADRTKVLDTLTILSFFGGLGLVLLVAMLGLLKVVSGVHLWVPAVGVTTCCLLIGVILMDPARLRSGRDTAIAFLPFHVAPPEAPAEDEIQEALTHEEMERFDEFAKEGEKGGVPVDAPLGAEEVLADVRGFLAEEAAGDRWLDRSFMPLPGLKPMGEIDGDGHVDELLRNELAMDLRVRDKDLGQGDFRRRWRQAYDAAAPGEDLEEEGSERFLVRQYAHQYRAGASPVRSDFAETLFWHPMLIAGKDGTATVSFDLSDSITTFRLRADAHGAGRIGSGSSEVISRIPFNLEPKLPLEVNAGDRIDLPLAVVNDTDAQLPVELTLEPGGLVTLDGPPERKLELGAQQRAREHFVLNVTGRKGDCQLTFRGSAAGLADAVGRPLKVVPPGFPKRVSSSGQIDGPQEVVVELPELKHRVPGSLEVTLNAFPSALAELQQGMESMLREPCGCFEQASTSNYPNVLSLQYMQEHDVVNPAVTRRAKGLLKKGYVKLAGYECPKKGYEWFGGDPGHEALTAYGLMEFRDMAEVYDVDPEMIERTARWLMDRRDGRGGFQRNSKALDSFGQAPQEITNAYITWALSESGQGGIEAEIRHVAELAKGSDDPYLIALAAASSLNADRQADAQTLLAKLADAQAEDGHLEGKQGSITRSGGQSLRVETTALAALAWLKMPAYLPQANKAIAWIAGSRQGSGGFGSTQATILALKALIEHSQASRKTLTAGKLIIKRDDLQIGEHAFAAGSQETVVVDGLEANLQPGRNKLTINLTGQNKMPYALDVSYRTFKPAGDENCPVRLSTKLAHGKVTAGETVALTAEVANATDEGQPMTIAILGLPAGLEAQPTELEELKKAGTIDYYETRARQVICYWRSLAPKKKVTVKFHLVAAVPGKYTGPASRTYLYYTSEQKHWADPLEVEITRD